MRASIGRAVSVLAGVLILVFAPAAGATFPGQNGKIAFSGCGSVDCGVFTINPDGTGRTQITFNPHRFSFGRDVVRGTDSQPAWSADGTQIAFSRWTPEGYEIWVASAGGSNAHGLGVFGKNPAWSPDGSEIAFDSGTAPGGEVLVVDSDGTNIRQVSASQVPNRPARNPDWSPDGTKIAYSDSRQDGWQDPEIWVVDAQGGAPVSLTPPDLSQGSSYPRFSAFDPSWSPDSSEIAFSGGPNPSSQRDVFVINADGGGMVDLTPVGPQEPNRWDENPAWSPDATRIAFERNASARATFVMNADGTGQQPLAGAGPYPAWQPVIPNQPPDCSSVRATPAALGAPNHRLTTVSISGATDPDGDQVDLEITGVTQDEPATGPPDAVATTIPNRVRLRAERDPHGDGRVYRIAFKATDGRGGSCTGFATASVRKGSAAPVDSAPPSYDSLGS